MELNGLGCFHTRMCTGGKILPRNGVKNWSGRGAEGAAQTTVSAVEDNASKQCLSWLSVCILSDSLQSVRQQAAQQVGSLEP